MEPDLDQRLPHPRGRLDGGAGGGVHVRARRSRTCDACRAAGLDVNRVGERLSFFFNAHNDFLEEIAKFRAARRLWAHLMRDRFGATSPRAQQLRFHTQTAGSTLTAQQPDNNIVRVTLQALAAVLGGTQSLHTNGRDEALALPTETSATVALRTQQILLHETGVANTVDPVAGSYAIEALTDRIEREARMLIEQIDAAGGTLAAIDAGLIQRRIQESAYRAQQGIDSGAITVVGVNRFADDTPPHVDVFAVDPSAAAAQVARVQAVRASRSRQDCQTAIDDVAAAARDGRNSGAADSGGRRAPRHGGRDRRRTARRLRRTPRRVGSTMSRLLDVQNLTVRFARDGAPAVDGVSFHIDRGETLGLVGESGSGKSVTAFSVLRLLQPPGQVTGGRGPLRRPGPPAAVRVTDARGPRGRISLIFQEPMTALNPVMRVGDQIAEALTSHGPASRHGHGPRRSALLESVGITDPARRACATTRTSSRAACGSA